LAAAREHRRAPVEIAAATRESRDEVLVALGVGVDVLVAFPAPVELTLSFAPFEQSEQRVLVVFGVFRHR
jgi:hypothetical protein